MTEANQEVTTTVLTSKQIEYYLLLSGLKGKLSDNDTKRFIAFAELFQLNPFKRELHCLFDGIGSEAQVHIVVGYEVYIKRAECSGKLDGWNVRIEGEDDSMKAIIEIHRKDWGNPFTHEVYWSESAQKKQDGTLTAFWQRMPRFQLKKVAISQGFRLCFSDQLGGMPYEAAELPLLSDQLPSNVSASRDTRLLTDSSSATVPAEKKAFDPKTFSSPFIDLEHYLKEHEKIFTQTHIEWIKSRLMENRSEEKARAMLSYAHKVVREAKAKGTANKNSKQPVEGVV